MSERADGKIFFLREDEEAHRNLMSHVGQDYQGLTWVRKKIIPAGTLTVGIYFSHLFHKEPSRKLTW